MAERRNGILEYASRRKYGEFYKFYEGRENDDTGNYDYIRKGRSGSGYDDDDSLTKAEQRLANTAYLRVPISRLAADQYKTILGKPYAGNIIAEPKAPEPELEPEVQTLGKSESELSRRERLRRRRDAAFQFAALQKQGGKAQSGV